MKSSSFFFLMVFFATALTITVPLTTSAALLCTNLRADLSFGDSDSYKNAQVTVLQKFLGAFGYLSAPANGNFGPSTLAAVKSFQSRNTLPSTGTVGPLTRSTIQKLSCVSQAAAVSIAITP
ncbi:MAG: peptidoglycan-binding domain-containing protein, partial [Patescibacteria group bacterium]